MRSAQVVSLALFAVSVSASASSAGKSEIAAKAAAVVKAGQAVPLPAGAAALKGKAVSALGTLPADAAKAFSGQGGFSPQQLAQIQAQAGQAFSALSADPKVAAAAAQAGVSSQKLDVLQAQTSAAVAGFKGPDGKVSVEAAAQQAQDFMKSEPVAKAAGQAGQAVSELSADPQFVEAAGRVKKGAQSVSRDFSDAEGRPSFAPEKTAAFKAKASKAVSELDVAAETASLKANARRALVKFCKKYQGHAQVPARCRKVLPAPVTE